MELRQDNIKFALDIGTRSVIGSVGVVEEGKLRIIKECYIEHEERAMIDGQIHDIGLVANVVQKVVNSLQQELGIKLEKVSIAAAGRFLKTVKSTATIETNKDEVITKELVRTIELAALNEGEKSISKELQGNLYCVGHSILNYYLNGFVISNLQGHKGENIGVEMISTFLPNVVVESLYAVMNICKLKVNNMTLEPIAAIEAVVPQNLRLLNIALVDIGAGTSDIAISSNQAISAYGMVPFAGDEITEVIARECLVDFNSAEVIKRKINKGQDIEYVDILGLSNTKTAQELNEVIRPTVVKMAAQISKNILMLNGRKAPSAIFLVGGGAHTPGLLEELSREIGLPMQRIGIKDRTGIPGCIADNNMGSAGVTVIGIALIGIKDNGSDFIDVYLNNTPISLFNSFKHTVADVLVAASINPSMLISRLGKNLKYTLNGKNKVIFGERGTSAVIEVNGNIATIDTIIKEGDKINIQYAVDGNNAKVNLFSLIGEFDSKSFYVDKELLNTEPVIIVNSYIIDNVLEYDVKDGDIIEIVYPENIEEIKKYILKSDIDLYKNDNKISHTYIVIEGDHFTTMRSRDTVVEKVLQGDANEEVAAVIEKKEVVIQSKDVSVEVDEITSGGKDIVTKVKAIESVTAERIENNEDTISILVNGKTIKLPKDKSNLFFQVFNYVDINLDGVKSIVSLTLNGEKANYVDPLKDGDVIEIKW